VEEKNSYEELYKIMKNSPHVVLLGAGASYACIPKGDKNGRRISCMDNFFENTGIDIGYTGSYKNLEDIYQDIDSVKRILLEEKIRECFNKFELPDAPTIYDALVISLTKKDFIASFNWDPLLVQAFQRCRKITKDLPEVAFLHGNVREYYALGNNGEMTAVFAQSECPHGAYIKTDAGERCQPTPLLYPIKEKNYDKDQYIKKAWAALQEGLQKSFMFTIFGYSGPKTDTKAIGLIESGFLVKEKTGDISDINNYKQLTIIDKNENILDSFQKLLNVPQVPLTEGIGDYVEVLNDFWDEDNWLVTCPRLSTEIYTVTQYKGDFIQKDLMKMDKNNLTWDNLKDIALNQTKKEDI